MKTRRKRWIKRGVLAGALIGSGPFWFIAQKVITEDSGEPHKGFWVAVELLTFLMGVMPWIVIGAALGAVVGWLSARIRERFADPSSESVYNEPPGEA
jgi:NhaP-type Na+/H+ or K+/H+ antiporter